jgi:hypothetical protein
MKFLRALYRNRHSINKRSEKEVKGGELRRTQGNWKYVNRMQSRWRLPKYIRNLTEGKGGGNKTEKWEYPEFGE